MRGFIRTISIVSAAFLAGCNSAETVLTTASDSTTAQQLPPPLTPGSTAGPIAGMAGSPMSLASVRVNLAPIVGAPVAAVAPMSKQFSAEARARKLTLVSAGAPGTTHVVKGYFSAFPDNGATTVIFVWDILDAAGNRLHRIQGQKQSPGANEADAWAAVTPQTMEAIAVTSVNELVAWFGAPRSV